MVSDANYRWVMVVAGAVLGCVAMGCLFSLPIYLVPMAAATHWSRTGISSAMTISFLAMAFASVAWGSLSDRFGPRVDRADRVAGSGRQSLPRQPRPVADRVPASVRIAGRCGRRRLLRPADRGGHRLVRDPARPRRVAGFCRHRDRAGHHDAAECVAGRHLRLARVDANPGSDRGGDPDPGHLSSPAPAGARRARARGRRREPSRRRSRPQRHDGARGAPVDAVHHPRADQLLLLRHPLRPDLPHGQLRHHLRHSGHDGGHDLQRRGHRRHGRPPRLRCGRRPAWCEERPGMGAAGPGGWCARLLFRRHARRRSMLPRPCSGSSIPASCRSTR